MDYKKLGLKAGLEIHQQLDTAKLFCNCPSLLKEGTPNFKISRNLRPVAGETGLIDPAALQAYLKGHSYTYHGWSDCNCLVEIDEQPPNLINSEALETVHLVSLMLNCNIFDEAFVMRKTVIDGSNVSGFQRTSLVAEDGQIDIDGIDVKILSVCIEEDAARKIGEEEGKTIYNLDRLGIPLIEMATDPCIHTPEEARKVARGLGDILRATKKVKRGIGTIRQDLNISIRDGARVELKGVQDLNMLSKQVEHEVLRQVRLLEIRDELKKRGAQGHRGTGAQNVTELFRKTKAKVIKHSLEKKGVVFAVKLPKFNGLLGKEVQPGRRLGSELSDYAKALGAKGLFHSDELPNYGITETEVTDLRKKLACKKEDGFILIAESPERCEKCVNAAITRVNMAFDGVPEETRKAQMDGTSTYLRPLPGKSRMYPETDLPAIRVTKKYLDELQKKLPELPWKQIENLSKKHKMSHGLAETIYRSKFFDLFNELIKTKADPTLIATTLTATLKNSQKDADSEADLSEGHLRALFKSLVAGKFSKGAIPQILEAWYKKPELKIDEITKKAGAGSLKTGALDKIVRDIVKKHKKMIDEKGERAIQPLMGLVMKEVRGKADGKQVMELLRKEVLK
jgi:glutamyl-tRNA(Gln) amidotransferase subunit E